nr:PAS domain S-box protein [Gemmatimonadaceae bacterium]
ASADGGEWLHQAIDALLDSVGVFVPVRDADDAIIDLVVEALNRRAGADLGLAAAAASGRRVSTLHPALGGRAVFALVLDAARVALAHGEDLEYAALPVPRSPSDPRIDRWFDLRAVARGGRLFVSWRDVTEQVRARQRRDADDRRLRTVLDTLAAFVGLLDLDGTVLEANLAPLQAAGLTLADVRGRPFWECPWWSYDAQVQAQVRDACRAAARGETVRYDVVVRMAGDSRATIEFQIAPLRDDDGVVTHLVPSAVDITGRVAAIARLRESEERFRAMADDLPLIVWVHDELGRLRYVNRTYATFFGVERDAVLRGEWQPLLHPEDRDGYVGAVTESVRTRTPFRAMVRARTAGGAWRTLESWARPRFAATGDYLGHVGTGVDVTERVRAEAAARESTARLAELAQALQETDRRKDEFLAMLAHELRNPLAPVRYAAQALKVAGGDAPLVVQAREMIERQVAHMARLIDDLLDVSRIAQGKIRLQLVACDLRTIVEQVVDDYRPLLAAADVTLAWAAPSHPVPITGDGTRLAQLLGNLLHNSAKFTDAGGRVSVSLDVAADDVELVVADSGIGIDPAMLPRLFEPFMQGDTDLARSRGGLGLGLALVKGLAELHGGSARVASDGVGLGTRVAVRLPLQRADAPAPTTDRRITPPSASRTVALRILVIEDNRAAADGLRLMLELLGHRVLLAHDGVTGVETAVRERPDAIVCDIGLPRGMDGCAVVRMLRALPTLAATRMIALSGYGREEDVRRALDAGFEAHLVKPASAEQLAALLATGAG